MGKYQATIVHQQEFARGEAHSFDVEAFNDAISSQGVTFVHYRAMGCPFGMKDPNDAMRHAHPPHPGTCSGGFLYKKAGEVTALFSANSQSPQFQDVGLIDGSTAQITAPHRYDDGSKLYMAPFDRLYLADARVLWPNWQRVKHNIQGRDRLQFPVVEVQTLYDNRLEEYHQGVDFEIRGGEIWWLGDRRPGIDPESQEGRVITVTYLYQPYWYVQRLGHAIRVVQAEDEVGDRVLHRLPFQATIVRENVFENQQRQDDAETERDQPAPEDGSFSPG
jgi:hypothetical protein